MNGQTFSIHCIPQKNLSLKYLIQSHMRIRCFAIAGAGPRMKSVPLQLQIWCSCITQSKRACTVPLKMIGVQAQCI